MNLRKKNAGRSLVYLKKNKTLRFRLSFSSKKKKKIKTLSQVSPLGELAILKEEVLRWTDGCRVKSRDFITFFHSSVIQLQFNQTHPLFHTLIFISKGIRARTSHSTLMQFTIFFNYARNFKKNRAREKKTPNIKKLRIFYDKISFVTQTVDGGGGRKKINVEGVNWHKM